MQRRPRSTHCISSAASVVYKGQVRARARTVRARVFFRRVVFPRVSRRGFFARFPAPFSARCLARFCARVWARLSRVFCAFWPLRSVHSSSGRSGVPVRTARGSLGRSERRDSDRPAGFFWGAFWACVPARFGARFSARFLRAPDGPRGPVPDRSDAFEASCHSSVGGAGRELD